jgi:hypothetical protein
MDSGLDSGLTDSGAPGGDARVVVDGSCPAPHNIATTSAFRCPIQDICPDCSKPSLPDGVYVQLTTLPAFGSACGSCQAFGTLRVADGVFDLVTDEAASICTGYVPQQTRIYGSYTLEGDALHVVDRCGAGALDWTVRASDAGMVRLRRRADLDAGSFDQGWVFQKQ